MYRKSTLDIQLHLFENICPDSVVFSIESCSIHFIAPYITPRNSSCKRAEIFPCIQTIVQSFRHYRICLIGDLNSRCGNVTIHPYSYVQNPDPIVNPYGKNLMRLCNDNGLVLVNGLKYEQKTFNSCFTFYRGKVKSQNDWCASNYTESIESFSILPKPIPSDHTPLSMNIRIPWLVPLELWVDISGGMFSCEMHDRSKIMKPKMTIDNVNADDLQYRFDSIADYITNNLHIRENDINNLSTTVNDRIYDVCSKTIRRGRIIIPPDKRNLSSLNVCAIANANLEMYTRSIQRNDDAEQSIAYFRAWKSNIEYATQMEKDEYNEKVNVSWRTAAKENPKRLWEMIDYNENASENVGRQLAMTTTRDYFANIFQSKKIVSTPTVADIEHSLNDYNIYIPILDDEFTIDELNLAIQKKRKRFWYK